MSSSLFVKYGVKAGGGPAFLKRTRTAFGQLQTRTRTGYNYTVSDRVWTEYSWLVCGSCTNLSQAEQDQNSWNPPPKIPGSQCTGFGDGCSAYLAYGGGGGCSTNWNFAWRAMGVRCEARTYTACAWNAYTGWSNVSSCTVSSPGCPSTQRQCQTIYSFREEDWSAYEEADICTPQSPNPSAGAVQIECVPQ